MNRPVTAALSSLVLALACGSTIASEPETATSNAMRVTIDKQTGKLRAATAQEAAELARLEALERRTSAADATTPATEAEAIQRMRLFPSGFVGMELPLSLYSSLAANVGADGQLEIRHEGADATDSSHTHDQEASDDLR